MASTPEKWDVEDPQFWDSTGKKIAYRNLVVSIPNLLCGFAVWLYWGMIAKIIQKIHFGNKALFDFDFFGSGSLPDNEYRALLFTLPAVAGLAGATLRLPNSFMIAISGGRNVKFMTTVLLIIPAVAAGFALQDPNVSFITLVILAAMSGVGGGAFSSSMSNISFFFPKKMQGLSLGLNAGIGNFGVSVMQFLIPWVITFGAFGSLGGDGHVFLLKGADKTLWVQNAALVWVPIMSFLAIAAWIFMNNLPQHQKEAGPAPVAIGKFLWLTILGFCGAALGIFLLLLPKIAGFEVSKVLWTFVILPPAIVTTLLLMRYATPASTRSNIQNQFKIFKNKHNWVMTYLYVMTFGSFIGYANAFPKLIDDVFGVIQVDKNGELLAQAITNPNAPASSAYIFIGAGVGALIRPLGGWLSDKWGGAKVTQYDTIIMVAATILAGYFVYQARLSTTPEDYFFPFLISFIVLFATTGIGNGSTFRMIPIIFNKEQAGPVLGFTAAIAAYGAYLIPKLVGTQIAAGTPEIALYGFAAYYATCLAVNWWFYARKNAEIPC
ncbi:MAG: MFS transporter [Planctomycetota bacterium]|jgi:NNP family nitrate/nitrite transporter-like MFS transporter